MNLLGFSGHPQPSPARFGAVETSKLESKNPATGESLGSLNVTPSSALLETFNRSRQAQSSWACLPLKTRIQKLIDLREVLIEERHEIASLLSRENGKPIFEALSAELLPAVDLLTYYARNSAKILKKRKLPLSLLKYRKSEIEHWPLGVVAVISPWNYPFLLPFGEIAPILTAGNAVVFKPSEVTPLIGLKIQSLFEKAGYPTGLLQTVIGDGTLGQALIEQKPAKVFFTGSVATGRKVMTQAASHLIPVNLELGGKDALIVLDDADLDYATSCVLWGAFTNSGQVCASTERVLIHESIAGEFKNLLSKKAKSLRPGDPLNPSTDLGAVTFEKQKSVYEAHLSEARSHGAEITFGGTFSPDRTRLAPTLITGAGVESLQAYTEETFGPVVALTTFKNDGEAVLKANSSRYGLVASVISRDLGRARKLASQLEVGTVNINEVLYTAGLGETPWGGIKESGIGRSHGPWGLLEAVHVRHVHSPRLFSQRKSPWWFPYSRLQYDLFDAVFLLYRKSWIQKISALPRLIFKAISFFKNEDRI